MKEIKFRAWDKDKSKMILPTDIDNMNYWDGVTWTSVEIINSQLGCSLYNWMQYTWLSDKHWVEIYEGDIVLIWLWDNQKKRIIQFERGIFWYINNSLSTLNPIGAVTEGIIEVIWNRYENKELLN